MRILILGGDGYLGWPTAMHFACKGHEVCVVDNYFRREIARDTDSLPLIDTPRLPERARRFKAETGCNIRVEEFDCCQYDELLVLFKDFVPDTVVHYAEQPSAPYSMMGRLQAASTLHNNLGTTFNLIWACLEANPDCHVVKLGTMGEYGTPNIDIEEGWIEICHKGRKQEFLFPRQAGSLYHTTKVLDTDLLWFYVRTYGLRVTDLMQGPVYGMTGLDGLEHQALLPNFHYDDIFGTVVNRFLVQAVAGIPLTIFGEGGQTRGYLNLKDTLQCVELAVLNPPETGKLQILNQFTETFSVNQIAEKIVGAASELGINASMEKIPNPRKELENHYYNPVNSGLLELGLKPNYMTNEVLVSMLKIIVENKSKIVKSRILPRVRWSAS